MPKNASGERREKQRIMTAASKGNLLIPTAGLNTIDLNFPLKEGLENLSMLLIAISNAPNGRTADNLLEQREEMRNMMNGLVRDNILPGYGENWMPSMYTCVADVNGGSSYSYGKGIGFYIHFSGISQGMLSAIPKNNLAILMGDLEKQTGEKISEDKPELLYELVSSKTVQKNIEMAKTCMEFWNNLITAYFGTRLEFVVVNHEIEWINPLRTQRKIYKTAILTTFYGKRLQEVKEKLKGPCVEIYDKI